MHNIYIKFTAVYVNALTKRPLVFSNTQGEGRLLLWH